VTARMDETRWLDDSEQESWRAYLRGSRYLEEALDRDLQEHGLQLTEYEILSMLSESDGSGHLARWRALDSCGETGDLARRSDGRVIAAWASCAGEGEVRAQSRTARGHWGRVRTIHRGEDREVVASFEPGSGRPVVAWVDYDFHRRHGPDALMVAAGDPRRIR